MIGLFQKVEDAMREFDELGRRLPERSVSSSPSSPPPSRSPRMRQYRFIHKLSDGRHFHFPSVELGPIGVAIVETGDVMGELKWKLSIDSEGHSWVIERTWNEIVEFDRQLHRCVFERRHSRLPELETVEMESSTSEATRSSLRYVLDDYCSRLSRLTGSLITCYPVLKFLEVDTRGRHFAPAEMSAINTPAIAAAIVTKQFIATSPEQLTIRVGDIISIIEMCSRQQSDKTWWKAKLTISSGKTVHASEDENANAFKQIGFFPSDCVQLFEDKGLPSSSPTSSRKYLPFSVSRKVGDLIRIGVKRRHVVFGVDLDAHLEKTGRRVPLILEKCVAAIEEHGIVTGIYRQCGIQSNIQRLRAKFDSGADPDLLEFAIVRDIYCVSSLLKQYFRQLPNPLFTFQYYSRLLEAYDSRSEEAKIKKLREVLEQMPRSHYNTARYLLRHLSRLCDHTDLTDMTSRNLAIVWAPNLFRAPPTPAGHDSHLLNGLNVHTSLCNFLIEHAAQVFPNISDDESVSKHLTISALSTSPILATRHDSFNDYDTYNRKKSSENRWSRVFRGKSVDGFLSGFSNRRRTINGTAIEEEEKRREKGRENEKRIRMKWRRSQSSDAAFRANRSESIMSMVSKGVGEIRDGVRSITKRAYSLRPGSRPPPSPSFPITNRRMNGERMQESVTISTISRLSANDAEKDDRNGGDESPGSSTSSFYMDNCRERRVAFRNQLVDRYPRVEEVPLGERSSPVEEWSSDSRNSPHLEVSRYDNVSPSRPREHIIDRAIVNLRPVSPSYDEFPEEDEQIPEPTPIKRSSQVFLL